MNKHIKIDELSAYLDGEAANASVLKSHLDGCESCRKELSSMRSLTERMQEMPEPEVHPAFATRVLAVIAEEETVRGRSGILRWVYGLAPVGIVAALIMTITFSSDIDTPNGGGLDNDSAQNRAMASILKQDEEALFDELSAHFAQSDSSDSIITSAYQITTPEPALPDPALLVFALGDSNVRSSVDEQWPSSKDVRTTINHLNAEESSLFKQMLVVHAQEALLGKASFEG